ncbi:MAG: hypothetical protein WB998_14265 [Solirubrobacteraceae bacterium]
MGRHQAILLAATVALAVGLGVVPVAAAEAPQWLVEGAPIAAGTTVSADVEHEAGSLLLLEDMSAPGAPDILCEVENGQATLLYNGEAEITKMECIKPAVDSGTCSSPKILPVNLPWRVFVAEPSSGVFEAEISSTTGSGAGWAIECTVLGVKSTDTCTSNQGKSLLTNTEAHLVDSEFMEEMTKVEEATCTIGGKEVGLTFGLLLFQALNAGKEAVALSVARAPVAFEGPSWWVKGARAGAGFEKSVSTISNTTFTMVFTSSGMQEFKCKKFDYLGKIIGSAAERMGTSSGTITFGECVDETEKGCEIYSLMKEGTELSGKGTIGPINIEATLAFAANVRTESLDAFFSLEKNAQGGFVFVIVLIEKKSGEACALAGAEGLEITGSQATVLENPANNTPIGSGTELTKVQLGFLGPTRGEEWDFTNNRYLRVPSRQMFFEGNPLTISGSAVIELNLPEAFVWVNK